jgi:hypothetical protein
MSEPVLWHDSVPAMDCLMRGHLLVTHTEPGAFETYPDSGEPTATWCLWCGGGVSNELIE